MAGGAGATRGSGGGGLGGGCGTIAAGGGEGRAVRRGARGAGRGGGARTTTRRREGGGSVVRAPASSCACSAHCAQLFQVRLVMPQEWRFVRVRLLPSRDQSHQSLFELRQQFCVTFAKLHR